jgi:hypothetical protein
MNELIHFAGIGTAKMVNETMAKFKIQWAILRFIGPSKTLKSHFKQLSDSTISNNFHLRSHTGLEIIFFCHRQILASLWL